VALDQYKTQVLLLHSQQSALDTLSAGWNDKYSIHVATSGTEALHIFNETPVHVIVSAQKLPGMSGLDALREARKRSPETIGILLAGNDTSDGLEALVGDNEVFQIVRGDVTAEGLRNLIASVTTRSRLVALSESANDNSADVDEPYAEHIIMETSENGSTIISGGTGRMPILKPEKVAPSPGAGGKQVDVLVLTRDEEFLSTIRDSSRGTHDVHHCVTPSQADEIVANNTVGVLVTDAAMVGSKIDILTQRLRQSSPRLVAVVAGRRDDGELLMDLINRGLVYRFLLKPVSPGRARLAIEASVKHHLEAPDTAFKSAAQRAAAPAKPAPAPTPAKPARPTASVAPRPAPQAAPARPAGDKPKRSAERPQPITPPRRDSLMNDGLDEAFGDDSSFTETITGLAVTIGKKLSDVSGTIATTAKARKAARAEKAALAAAEAARKTPPRREPTFAAKPAPAPTPEKRTPRVAAAKPAPAPAVPRSRSERPAASRPAPAAAIRASRPASAGLTTTLPGSGHSGGSRKILLAAAATVLLGVIAMGGWFMMGSGDDAAPETEESLRTPSFDETEIPVPTAATPQPARGADELLAAAREALEDGRLIAPASDNAVELYVAAVVADPDNADARAELATTIDRVVGLAESAILEQRLDDASAALQMIELGSPDNPRLAFLNAQLDQLQLRDAMDEARLAIREKRFEDAGRMIERGAAHAGGMTPELQMLRDELASARSAQRVDETLAMANARLEQDQLISPSNNNARYFFELALSNAPDNAAARQGLEIVASKLVLQARTAIDAGQLVNAEDLLRNARAIDPSSAELAAATSALQEARTARNRAPEETPSRAVDAGPGGTSPSETEGKNAAQTAVAGVAAAPADRTAAADSTAGSTGDNATVAEEAVGSESLEPAEEGATGAAGTAMPVADEAATLAALNPTVPSANDAAANFRPAQRAPEIRTVQVSELTRINYVAPKYPRAAQRRNVTGSVDVGFTVAKDGTVTDLRILDSTPGSIFDDAALEAVAEWRFAPAMENGQPVERRTVVRLAFDLE